MSVYQGIKFVDDMPVIWKGIFTYYGIISDDLCVTVMKLLSFKKISQETEITQLMKNSHSEAMKFGTFYVVFQEQTINFTKNF